MAYRYRGPSQRRGASILADAAKIGLDPFSVCSRVSQTKRKGHAMGGPTRNKALETLHLAQNAAREAQRKADILACEAWNARMGLDGGPLGRNGEYRHHTV